MIQDTLTKIVNRIKNAAIPSGNKAELLKLLAELQTEVGELAKTKKEQSESIAGFTQLSAHEATREKLNPQLLKLSLEGLSSSVEEFEVSHPKLVDNVNRICTILANMGI